MQDIKKNKISPYFYVLPSILIIGFVYFLPVINTIRNSFFRVVGSEEVFVGFQNYYFFLFKDNIFWSALLNNLKLLLGIPILVFGSLIIASLLYQQIVGWKFFRIVLLIPYILSITVVGIVFDYIFRLDGVFNNILETLHLNFIALDWLGNSNIAIFTILGVVIWKEIGFGIILFLARMLSIDISIYEAAKVDGSSWLRTLFFITIPQLKSVIAFYLVINVINMFSWMFNYIFVMTRGGPMNSTYVLEYYIYRQAFRYRQIGLASTIAVILFIIAIIFIILQFIVRSRALKEEGIY